MQCNQSLKSFVIWSLIEMLVTHMAFSVTVNASSPEMVLNFLQGQPTDKCVI